MMLNYKSAALLALATFVLGLGAGKGLGSRAGEAPTAAVAGPAMASALPAGHPNLGERSLEDVIATTLQMREAATLPANTRTTPAAASASAQDLTAQADELRRQRKFREAITLYRRLAADGVMNADTWADYADALASADSSLQGEPATAVAKALALDPRHAKALWLKASLEHEERQYADAVRTWRRLLAVVPAGSSDARIIEANIAEASRLASSQG